VAVYTDINDQELESLLEGFDLGRALSCKGVAEGIENSNFILDTERGRFVLTIYERRVRPDELPYFIDLMRWLAGRGFPCPTPIADRAGRVLTEVRGKPTAIVSFLTGLSVRRPTAAQCREVGLGLARLHEAAEGFPGRRPNALGLAAWAPLFAPRQAAAAALEPGLDQRVAADLEALAEHWPEGLPAGPIHADLFPDNVFFDRNRFVGAIDFYFACDDALAYDLAICLNAWCFEHDGRLLPSHARALLGGYETLRPLSERERAALPVLARGAAMRFFLTRLVDWQRGAEGALVTPKDPMEYARRLDVHRRGGLADALGISA
jgi:homoserine kinase type II